MQFVGLWTYEQGICSTFLSAREPIHWELSFCPPASISFFLSLYDCILPLKLAHLNNVFCAIFILFITWFTALQWWCLLSVPILGKIMLWWNFYHKELIKLTLELSHYLEMNFNFHFWWSELHAFLIWSILVW